MLKKLLSLSGTCLFITQLSAQISLSATDYNTANIAGTSDQILLSTAASVYPSLAPMANATWDMTTATSTVNATSINHVAAVAAFSAQFADSIKMGFAALLPYSANTQLTVTSPAYQEKGAHIERLAAHFGNTATDSIIIDGQDLMYTAPRTVISFPATLSSRWTSDYVADINFELSYNVVGFDHQPGILREYVTETDTVIGWGKMRVTDASGNASVYLNVLQVQSKTVMTDSFLISGASAVVSAAISGALQSQQGQVTTTYQQNYYRTGELIPLANVTFTDGTYSTPSGSRTHAERLFPAAVKNIEEQDGISIYPNPVTNRTFSVDIKNTGNGNWTYELINIAGQKVSSAPLNASHTQVNVSSKLAPGIYYLGLKNNGMQVLVKPIDITE